MSFISNIKLNGTIYNLRSKYWHTILNSEGAEATPRSNVKFLNATITDDEENDATVITPKGGADDAYTPSDTASDTINDTDYVPMLEGDTKKKTLWSTIIAKIKASISKSDVGLGNVPNVSTNNQKPTFTQASTRANIASGENLSTIFGKIMKVIADLKTVAFTGAYNDLSGTPTIPTKTSQLTNDSGYINSSTPVSYVSTPRTFNGDYNSDLPGANKTKIVEHGTDSPNRPSDHWYYVITMQGSDTAYATQLAYGMTTSLNYFREYGVGTWSSWYRFYTTADKPSKQAIGLGNVENLASVAVNRDWSTNNVSMKTLANGYYGTDPNKLPTEVASLTSSYSYFSQYGTLFVNNGSGGTYPVYKYTDVFGQVAQYNNNQNTWRPFRKPTGNATAAQVLSGYTFSNESSDGLTGNIPSRDPRHTYPAVQTGHNGTGSYVYIPYGYYQPNEKVNNQDSTWFYLTDSQVQGMHKHTATKTPTGGELNSSAMDLGDFHGYKYVNTAVCYNRGLLHYATNRNGFVSGFFKDNTAEYRMDLYDMRAGTTITATTTSESSKKSIIRIMDLSNYTAVAQQAYFYKDNPLTYTTTKDMDVAIVIFRSDAYTSNDFHYWWSVSNSNY